METRNGNGWDGISTFWWSAKYHPQTRAAILTSMFNCYHAILDEKKGKEFAEALKNKNFDGMFAAIYSNCGIFRI